VRVLLDPEVYSDTIYGHTQLSVLMCVISSGYFLHDLIIVLLRLDTEGMAMLIHACCCLFVYTYAVYSFYLTFYGECHSPQLSELVQPGTARQPGISHTAGLPDFPCWVIRQTLDQHPDTRQARDHAAVLHIKNPACSNACHEGY